MSLINEALKEARHEATRQDAIREGGLYPRLPFHGPPGTRRRRWWIAIVVVLLVAAGAGAGWWWRTTASPDGQDAAETVAVAEPIDHPSRPDSDLPMQAEPVPVAPAEGSPTVGADRPESLPAEIQDTGSGPPAQPEPMPRPVPGIEAASPVDTLPAADTRPAATPPAPGQSEASAEPVITAEKPGIATQSGPPASAPQATYVVPQPEPPDAVSFRREATLKDGTRLSLGGIAWSPSQPVALINGRVMAVGEIAEGFVLKEVKREYVYLKRRDQVVILTLE